MPGRPLFFATAMPLGASSTGLLVESHEGPADQDGRQSGPSGSSGACDVYAQASVLGLYDPDRSQALAQEGEIRSWGAFLGASAASRRRRKPSREPGCVFSRETVTSPTLAGPDQGDAGGVSRRQVASVGAGRRALGGGRRATGIRAARQHHITISAAPMWSCRSTRISLSSGPGSLRYARAILRAPARARRSDGDEPAVRGRADADSHGNQGRSSSAVARGRSGAVRLEPGRGAGRRHRRPQGRAERRRSTNGSVRSRGTSSGIGRQPGHRRRAAEPRGPCTGAQHERRAGQRGQDGSVHRAGRSQSRGPGGLAVRSGQGSGCRRGGPAADSGRQSGLQRAGRAGLPRPAEESHAARPPEPARRRDFRALPLAPAR